MKLFSNIKGKNFVRAAIALFFVINIASHAQAQIYKQVGDGPGLPYPVIASCSNGNDLYVAYSRLTKDITQSTTYDYSDTVYFAKWNGSFWTYLPKLVLNSDTVTNPNPLVQSMAYYNGELYVGGTFSGIKSPRIYSKVNGLVKWNGSVWGTKNLGIDTSTVNKNTIGKLAIFNNRMYALGTLYLTANFTGMAAWNGTNWDDSIKGASSISNVNDVIVANNHLYMVGSFAFTFASKYFYCIASWDDTASKGLQNFPVMYNTQSLSSITFFKGSLTVMGVDSSAAHLFTKQLNSGSTSWVNMSNGSFITAYSPGSLGHTTIRQFNNRMWAAGDIVDKPGKIHHLAVYDTSWTVFADTGDFFPYALETTSNSLFLTGKFGSISNQSLNNIAGISSLLATIRGKVYRDRDSNCTFNKGDDSLENRILSLDGGAAYFNTDAHGNYQVLTSVGTHTLHLLNQKNWVQTCPAGLGDLTVITVADNVYSGRNFASNLKPGIRDLRASISPTSRLHPGRTASYTMNYENLGSVSIDTAYLVISFDKRLSNFRADSTPVTDSGSYVIFAVRNLKSLEKRHFNFYLDAITTITTGDTLDISVRADSGLTYVDSNLVNNFDTLYEGVSNSHDPNGKVVAPDGNIAPSTEELKYTILFQNTGNDYAYQVVVIDSIDTNLPLTEIVMNSSSHKYSFNVDNNVFRWTFKDINLIDSNADPVNSRGYISFTAKIKKGLGVGTEIKNKAYIYFDYNPPVKTNETMCKLSLKSGIQKESFLSESIKLYPNPANDELLLENRSPETRQFIIYSSLGKQMQSLKIGKNQNEILNTSLYPAGIYVIRGDKGEFAKIIVQH